ncbi:hypothetical protein NVS55_07725 [Myxococcus stipitatus]|uniref:hypothetical protein n=1 Tax=Myxococcus stipitatus TaxID=83455 RepID=UPI0031455092
MRRAALGLVTLLVAGCSSGVDDVVAAWKAAGESPSAFADVGEKLPGGKCQAGKVSGLDATVCVFESQEKARQAEEGGWKLVGNSVGAAAVSGKMVLVVADSRKEDPSGRRLNALVKAFQAETR